MQENSNSDSITAEDVALSNMMEIVTICQLLVEKGIITHEEYLDKLEQVKKDYINKHAKQ